MDNVFFEFVLEIRKIVVYLWCYSEMVQQVVTAGELFD